MRVVDPPEIYDKKSVFSGRIGFSTAARQQKVGRSDIERISELY
jgi:hypothetical protein